MCFNYYKFILYFNIYNIMIKDYFKNLSNKLKKRRKLCEECLINPDKWTYWEFSIYENIYMLVRVLFYVIMYNLLIHIWFNFKFIDNSLIINFPL